MTGKRILHKALGKWVFNDYKDSKKPKCTSRRKWSKKVRIYIKKLEIDFN